jgi:hypothetical protein
MNLEIEKAAELRDGVARSLTRTRSGVEADLAA